MLFILYGKNSSSVGESNGTVLSTGNFGKKARNSPRSIVRKCDEANGSVIFRLFRQERERGIRLQLFLFFFFFSQKNPVERKPEGLLHHLLSYQNDHFFFFDQKEALRLHSKRTSIEKAVPPSFSNSKKAVNWLASVPCRITP